MSRSLRLEYAGACYHITARGDRSEAIVRDEEDRQRFVTTLGEACAKAGWQVHAYGLLAGHFHLVIETPQPVMVVGMKWLLATYTTRFNRRHRLTGHVFGGRYRALPIAREGDYLRWAGEHVHLNPVRAGLVREDQPLETFPWSSYPDYLRPPPERPGWLRVDRLLAAAGLEDDPRGRREFARTMEAQRAVSRTDEWADLRQGWCYGDERFRLDLLDRLTSANDIVRYGAKPPHFAVSQGERILREELDRLGWTEASLTSGDRTSVGKLAVARRLQREAGLSLRWIARRLSAGSANTLQRALRKAEAGPTPPRAVRAGGRRESDEFSVAWD
ncbi:MAG: transposase [Verrucomicrobiales bacterium]|nr:transposase [Verrucomicrobiales bacterium]